MYEVCLIPQAIPGFAEAHASGSSIAQSSGATYSWMASAGSPRRARISGWNSRQCLVFAARLPVTVSKAPPVFLDTDLGENPMSKEVGKMVRSRDVVQAEGSGAAGGRRLEKLGIKREAREEYVLRQAA